MIDLDPDAKLNMVGGTVIVGHLDMVRLGSDSMIRSMLLERMSKQVAAVLLNDGGLERSETKYGTEFRTRLYVCTPMQLEKYVQRRAEKLGYRPSPRFIEDDQLN